MTFRPGEEQLVGGIQAEHGLGVTLRHGQTLQGGAAATLHPPDGDDRPSAETHTHTHTHEEVTPRHGALVGVQGTGRSQTCTKETISQMVEIIRSEALWGYNKP